MTRARLFFGIAFLAVGGVLFADSTGLVDTGSITVVWWPAIVVLAGLARLVASPREVTGGIILVLVGGVLLLWTHSIVTSLALLWPVLLIAVGLSLLTRRTAWDGRAAVTSDGDMTVVLSDRRAKAADGPLGVRNVTTVLGDIDLDLTPATLGQDAALKVVGVLADIDITVPDDWHIVIRGTEVLGSVSSPTTAPPPGAPTLRIETVAVLAEITIHSRARVTHPAAGG